MNNIFLAESVFFNVLGYPMSYIEFFGTVLTGLSVYLAAKNKTINWPIGIAGTVLYGFLFYQIRLYSDFFEQIYYFVTGFFGWFVWKKMEGGKMLVQTTPLKNNLIAAVVIVLGTYALGSFMKNIHLILPDLFPEEASLPYLDAFTTVLSFVANIYLAKRKIENWYLWIVVDMIGVGLYYVKGVPFISLLYLAFLINALLGLRSWKKELLK